ncbi:gamma-crystallin-3-like [Dendropsophus ebraccatus]|uniref:gamma-crystallin-3-like n=1 Tax=Dendropsophus ebraccatus TaxID=150705 RepID=UPI003831B9D9
MGKIIFYKERDFQGQPFEVRCDSRDLSTYFNQCRSVRIGCGNWMLYEQPNFRGKQFYLRQGDYPEFQQWMGLNNSIRSCQLIPQHHGSFRIRIYEREDFGGQMMEFDKDCSNVFDMFHSNDIFSCKLFEGYWIFYEEPNYQGRQYYLRPGEYRRHSDWGAMSPKIGSFIQPRLYLQTHLVLGMWNTTHHSDSTCLNFFMQIFDKNT